MTWEAGVPGKAGTAWEGGVYPVRIEFSSEYPGKPPECYLPPSFFHPNIYPSGRVCLSILDETKGWKPSITLKQILLGIQDLLDNPNDSDPAQTKPNKLYAMDPAKYEETIRAQARKFRTDGGVQVTTVD
mmetsp:Transcript_18693/g.47310  ORF Transcript_18693/g.47310 Transcript_18693/m.47310 type:complete len:130 (+) Transcript_18693:97-486(+)